MDFNRLNKIDITNITKSKENKNLATIKGGLKKNNSLCLIFVVIISLCGLIITIIQHTKIVSINSKNNSIKEEENRTINTINELTNSINELKNIINKSKEIQRKYIGQIDDQIRMKNEFIIQNNENNKKTQALSKVIKRLNEQFDNFIEKIKRKEEYIKELQCQIKEKKNMLVDLHKIYSKKKRKDKQYDSILISSDQDYRLLSSWINEMNQIKIKLLYRGTESNFSIEQFHAVANYRNIKNTLLIIQMNNGDVIGGFTYNNWDSQGFKEDNYAILFNLDNRKYYRVIDGLEAIYTNKDYFAIFGRGDLCIYSKDEVFSSFPNNYGGKAKPFELTNGINQFKIKEIELFNIINI